MRLIDAEAWKLDLLLFHGCNEKTAWIFDRINHAPTVDAVPVIRCKDCIHRYSTCPMITIHPTGSISFRAQDDWFCFMGERKEE